MKSRLEDHRVLTVTLATKELMEGLVTKPVTIISDKGPSTGTEVITLCTTIGRGRTEISITANITYGNTAVDYYIGGESVRELSKETLIAAVKQQTDSLMSTIR